MKPRPDSEPLPFTIAAVLYKHIVAAIVRKPFWAEGTRSLSTRKMENARLIVYFEVDRMTYL